MAGKCVRNLKVFCITVVIAQDHRGTQC